MPKVVMNIRYVSKRAIIAMTWHEQHRTPDGASAIDPSRSHLNKVIRGPKTQEQALDRLFKGGVKEPTTQAETPYVQMVLSASPEYFRDEGQGPGHGMTARCGNGVRSHLNGSRRNTAMTSFM